MVADTTHTDRMIKAKYTDSGQDCQRVLGCETCGRIWNRDIAAAINIAFVAWHWLVFGKHGFRWRREFMYQVTFFRILTSSFFS